MKIFKKLLGQTMNEKLASAKFFIACQSENRQAIEKMIFEDNIEYSNTIKNSLKAEPTPFLQSVQEMFERREFNTSLENELNNKATNQKKVKI